MPTTTQPRGPGRPPKPEKERLSARHTIRLDAEGERALRRVRRGLKIDSDAGAIREALMRLAALVQQEQQLRRLRRGRVITVDLASQDNWLHVARAERLMERALTPEEHADVLAHGTAAACLAWMFAGEER